LIFTLAKEGGFTEAQIMDFETGIPVYRVNAYYHAALRSHDIWTCTPSAPAEHQIEELMAFLDNAPEEE